MISPPGGIIGSTAQSGSMRQSITTGLSIESAFLKTRFACDGFFILMPFDAERLCDGGYIRPALRLGRGKASVIEHLLPLAHHAEHAIVHNYNNDGDIISAERCKLAQAHMESAVPCYQNGLSLRLTECRAIAAPIPKPIAPSPPEVISERGRSKS